MPQKITHLFTAVVLSVFITVTCSPSAWAQVQYDWAIIGNSGNAADFTGNGAVNYDFSITTTETTNSQYAAFLNAAAASDALGLYDGNNGGGAIVRTGLSGSFSYAASVGFENKPVAEVTWYDAARYVNWIHNGQPTDGSGTETGAYTILGGTPIPTNASTISRSVGALFFLPNEDEWYKAAYHDASAGTAGDYFLYANGSDTSPASDLPGNDLSAANYDGIIGSSTDVGSYTGNTSSYGVFDLNGNLAEWTDLQVTDSNRGVVGGDFLFSDIFLRSTTSNNSLAAEASRRIGIRVATITTAVPEPSSAILLPFATFIVMFRRRRS